MNTLPFVFDVLGTQRNNRLVDTNEVGMDSDTVTSSWVVGGVLYVK
jgi:hypothetical protein